MVKSKIQDAGLRMKLQNDKNGVAVWFHSQIARLVSPIDMSAFRNRGIRLASFISGRADFAGGKFVTRQPVAAVAPRNETTRG